MQVQALFWIFDFFFPQYLPTDWILILFLILSKPLHSQTASSASPVTTQWTTTTATDGLKTGGVLKVSKAGLRRSFLIFKLVSP